MRTITKIKTFDNVQNLINEVLITSNQENSDFNKSTYLKQLSNYGIIEFNDVLFIYDKFNLLK
jgi:hypothetical protein